MKAVIINHSDSLGGASVVSYRLLKALQQQGVEASMLVTHKATDDPTVHIAAPRWRSRIPFYAEAARIFVANGFDRKDLFKVSLGSDGLPLSRHPQVREANVVLLGWINQGMLSLGEIGRIARQRRVIWTMHDMWCATALCHHAGTCRRYAEPAGCHHCPMLHSRDAACRFRLIGGDMTARVRDEKRKLYAGADIDFVAVSHWLADRCRESSLMADARVSVIPNPFPVEEFYSAPTAAGPKIILMGAARLDDPVKGLPLAIDMLNRLPHPERVEVQFFGALRDRRALDRLRVPYRYLGPIADPAELRRLYSQAHAVLSTSLYETLPGTLVEGQAAGAMPVSFDRGGQADIIRSDAEGALLPFGNIDAMAAALDRIVDTDHDRSALQRLVAERFSAEAVARQYINLMQG